MVYILLAVISTQIIAPLIKVYGIFLTPMGWKLAFLVWGCAIIAFIITDLLKVRFYRLIEHSGIKTHG